MTSRVLKLAGKAAMAGAGLMYGVWQGLRPQKRGKDSTAQFVTKEELRFALAAAEVRTDEKLQAQLTATTALRETLADTEALLNAVLEKLETAHSEEESWVSR